MMPVRADFIGPRHTPLSETRKNRTGQRSRAAHLSAVARAKTASCGVSRGVALRTACSPAQTQHTSCTGPPELIHDSIAASGTGAEA